MKPLDGYEVGQFAVWLAEAGCEILEPDGKNEVLRFKAPRGISIVRRSNSGRQSCVGPDMGAALGAFRAGIPWRPQKRQTIEKPAKRPVLIRTVAARDGVGCWYCGCDIDAEWTIEHLLARRHGGPTNAANVVLACKPCNAEAADRPVAEKVALRERKRLTASVAAAITCEPVRACEGNQ